MRASEISNSGFTLIELLISLAFAALLMVALTGVVSRVSHVKDGTQVRNDTTHEARFAMQRMVTAVRQGDRLLLPLADNPNTGWREDVREQTNPPTPPAGGSTLATAVLAVTMGPTLDRDEDGWADANNDKDFLDLNNNSSRDPGEPERIDEDLAHDNSNDGEDGIFGIDDDGDGLVDETGSANDDDEDGSPDEDDLGNGDEDSDGALDEDISQEMNNDGAPGILGFDDDYDGAIDEGNNDDDDEDGLRNEDWFDPVVFHLSGTTLLERLPDLNPIDGADFTEYAIAENVTHFRVERLPNAGKRAALVDITLEVTVPDGEPTSLNTRVRVGGGL